jgi:hypothetical protein
MKDPSWISGMEKNIEHSGNLYFQSEKKLRYAKIVLQDFVELFIKNFRKIVN